MISSPNSIPALAAFIFAFAPYTAAATSYTLSDSIDASNFAASFDFFNETSPTKGFVSYVSENTAQSDLLAGKTASGAIYLGTDATNKVATARDSVRVTSKKSYSAHLMVADIQHMPYGMGIWPALWELGSGAAWPANGEIDILEGVNAQQTNLATLHTSDGCKMTNTPTAMSGNMTTTDCYINSGNQPGNAGCSVTAKDTTSYGEGFNAAGGGIYAMEYSATAITIWFFSRTQIPADLASNSKTPDPSTWGTPQAMFTGCDIVSHFKNMQIIINTEICGSWAGTVWNTPGADGKSPATVTGVSTCDSFAANNPSAFEQAYWAINSIRVFEPAAAAKKRDIFDTYNSSSDPGYAQCQEMTPGHCKSKAQEQTTESAGSVPAFSWALASLAALGAVFMTL